MKNRSGPQFSMMSEELHRNSKQTSPYHDQNPSATKQASSKSRKSNGDIYRPAVIFISENKAYLVA